MAGLAWLVMFAAGGCTSGETGDQVAPVESTSLLDIVGDTPVEPLPVPASHIVGALPGHASVQGGGASYTIPIEVPPGRRGMQPEVSLEYDSRAASGIAGVGWALSAGSSIYRCPRTVVHDRETRSVNFGPDDRLCLDGRRLIGVRGVYGQRGSEYRTEIDSFARITLVGGSVASPVAYFRVESRTGTVQEYSAAHVPDGAPAPLAWKLRRVVDRQGNAMEYIHGPSSTGHVLAAIRYTDTGTAPGDRRVVFAYEHGRPDIGHAYRAGALERSPLRLTDIRTYIGRALVRRYQLEYRPSAATGRSLLARIRACGHEDCTGTDVTPWTTFSYAEDSIAFAPGELAEARGTRERVALVGDHDGDGTRDRMVLEYPDPWGGIPSRRLLHLSSRADALDLDDGPWLDVFDEPHGGFPGHRDTDVDRDGVADLVGRISGRLAIASWHGDRLVTKNSNLALPPAAHVLDMLDMDADGDTDVLVRDGAVIGLYDNCTERGSASIRFCGHVPVTTLGREELLRLTDLDGNALPDLVIDWNGRGDPVPTRVVFTRGAPGALRFSSTSIEALGGPSGSFRHRKSTGFFDANGDGLLDLYKLPDKLWLNTGGRFLAPDTTPGTIAVHRKLHDAVLTTDIDADGRDELLVPAALEHDWCYLVAGQTEPREYCGADFLIGDAPAQLDRSIYRWDAVRVRFDDRGAPRFEQTTTPLTAPVRASHASDFTGDGLADVHYRIADGYGETPSGPRPLGHYAPPLPRSTYLAQNLGGGGETSQVPDLLQRVRDGLGRVHTWAHAPLSAKDPAPGCPARPLYRADRAAAAPHHYHVTSSMPVVARFTKPSGVGAQNSTCYRYQDAMVSDQGRGFLGFRRIIAEEASETDAASDLRMTTRYHDAFPLTGRIAEVEEHLAGDDEARTPIRARANTWDARCAGGVCAVHPVVQTERVHDLATRALLSTTTTATTYDPYGNPSAIEVTIDDAFMTHVQRTAFEYDADVAAWWLDKLVRQTVTHEPVAYKRAPVPDAADNLASTVVTTFSWHGASGAHARLLREDVVQPGDPAQERRTRHEEYDAHGNLLRRTVRIPGDPAPRTTAWSYDAAGYLATSETNPAGHETTLAHAPDTGLLVEETRYGVTTRYTYDGLGRLVRTRRDGAPPIHTRRLRCDASCPPHARMRMATVQDGAPTRWHYLDALERVILVRESGFGGAGDIERITEYDQRGRLVRQTRPGTPASGAHSTIYSDFDALGRPGRKIVDRTGHAHDTFTTTYEYRGATTQIRLPGGLGAACTFDARGLVVDTVDTAGSTTHYRHDTRGHVILLEDSAGNRLSARHDDLGRRVALSDPDSGAWSFAYNGLGELVRQTDAAGRISSFTYDLLGRMRTRTVDRVLEATWAYDTDRPGTLATEASLGFLRTYTYDHVLRPTRVTTRIDGRDFVQEYAYGAYHGHLEGMRHPGGEIVAFDYDRHGYVTQERDPIRGTVYRRIDELTPDGQLARAALGNGVTVVREHIASTGQLGRVRAIDADGALVQDLAYEYSDPYGNLTRRENRLAGVSEAFTYDALQRLDRATRTWTDGRAPLVIDYAYDALGNLVRKDDFAVAYQYGDATRGNPAHAGPHAIIAITRPDGTVERDFAYDDSGNMIAGNGRALRYDAANKPVEIRERGVTTHFAYGPDHARFQQTRGSQTTYYIGQDYEHIIEGGEVRERTYIGDHVVIEQDATGRRVRYLHTDRLGSVDTITDERGRVVERHGYDAFGKPLTSDWEDAGGLLHGDEYPGATTPRGFTGHEHLDAHLLIHMGGRAYDPALGRFLSVDPVIQNPLGSQNLNPYSYILNNPLSGVDPTGYQCDPVDQDTAGCVDSQGHVITQPATAPPGNNGQQGQGVDPAARGPATDQGKPGGEASSRPWYSRTWRFIKREVAPRALGAVKVGAGFAGAAVGAGLCETGLGCAVGAPLIVASADVAGSGVAQVIHGAPQPTALGQQFGPTAQTVQEVVVMGAGLAGAAAGMVRSMGRVGGESAAAGGVDEGLAGRGFRPPTGTRERPQGVPEGWRIRGTKGEGGVRYVDPQNPHNSVRVMPGNPNSPYPNSRGPYVRWHQNGQSLDVNGSIVPKNSPEAHIPLSDFVYKP